MAAYRTIVGYVLIVTLSVIAAQEIADAQESQEFQEPVYVEVSQDDIAAHEEIHVQSDQEITAGQESIPVTREADQGEVAAEERFPAGLHETQEDLAAQAVHYAQEEVQETPEPPASSFEQPPKLSTVNFDYSSVESSDVSTKQTVLNYEFRIEVDARKTQCFHEYLAEGMTLYASFQVLRGIEQNIELTIVGPGNVALAQTEWTASGNIMQVVQVAGIYSICLKNEKSSYSTKLVHLYIVAYSETKWKEYSQNVIEFFTGADDVQKSLDLVGDRVRKIFFDQAQSRINVISDWYLLQSNSSYVQTLSIILCVIIVATSAFQVFFVRRLFNTRNVNLKSKPRA